MHTMNMATLLVVLLVIILVEMSSSESKLVLPPILPSNTESTLPTTPLDVFHTGKFHLNASKIRIDHPCSPPRRLLIVRPVENGTYPVILFHHGTSLQNSWYTNLLEFISSHGYIVVAPQLYSLMPPSGQSELNLAAKVANWLPSGLSCVLPENVGGNLDNLALAGHSRGGYIAFALALGLAEVPLNVHFSALVGIDPVAGTSKNDQMEPKILNYETCSLDLPPILPIAIIGTGLGDVPAFFFPPMPCAPDGVSHNEFFNECKPPCSHFVTADYGHMDMLDDDIGLTGNMARILCKGCRWGLSRDPMRTTIGGIVVAFLEAFFQDNFTDYNSILQQPNYFAPATLDPVQNKTSCSRLTAI